MDDASEIRFEAEDYRSQSNFSYKTIVLSQVQKVVSNASKEFKEGFFIYTNNPNQTQEKLRYVEDSRLTYFNSVDVLHDLLLPKFDDDMKKESEEIYKEVNDAKKKAVENIKANRDKAKPLERNFFETKIELYRKLFQELSKFLNREGWLEAEFIED